MIDALRSCWQMLVTAWRHHKLKLTSAIVLTIAAGLAWPFVALALKAATNATVAHDVHGATIAGALTGVGAIGVLMLRHFAWASYVEITEISTVTLEAELMTLANGSARIEHHERPEYADKITILQRELSGLMEGMGGLLTMLSLGVSLALTGVLLAFVNPWLLLLPLAAVPPVLTGQRASKIIERGKEESATATRQAWHLYRLATGAGSAKELRVFRLQSELRRRNNELWDSAGGTLMRAERRAMLVGALGQLVFATAYIVSVLLVVRQAVAGRSQVGDVVLVITLAAQVNQQVNSGLQELRNLQRIAYGFTRLRWLRALVASQQPPPSDTPMPERLRTGIELHDVAFTYPGTDRPVLADANLLLPAGSIVALVGENGAGKTTLVKLLCRFCDATSGTITVDGVDIQRLPLDAWRRRIAAGFQDFVRFELATQQTVGVGDLPHLDDDRAVQGALDRAGAADVVARLEEGLATHLGKSYAEGTELSSGQWQKLALGRAMMREAPLLLILDEPTSALDAEAEHVLFERYAENARRFGAQTGAITVLVSHRFSTVRMADLILVVADGRIAESGAHEALLQRNGLYAELYALQASAYR
jgi:ATP-binding cassette subfamily B protein